LFSAGARLAVATNQALAFAAKRPRYATKGRSFVCRSIRAVTRLFCCADPAGKSNSRGCACFQARAQWRWFAHMRQCIVRAAVNRYRLAWVRIRAASWCSLCCGQLDTFGPASAWVFAPRASNQIPALFTACHSRRNKDPWYVTVEGEPRHPSSYSGRYYTPTMQVPAQHLHIVAR